MNHTTKLHIHRFAKDFFHFGNYLIGFKGKWYKGPFRPDFGNQCCRMARGSITKFVSVKNDNFFAGVIAGIIIGNGTTKDTSPNDDHIGFLILFVHTQFG
ncbi:hypothetical protein D3C85_920060 [compost metagenome]